MTSLYLELMVSNVKEAVVSIRKMDVLGGPWAYQIDWPHKQLARVRGTVEVDDEEAQDPLCLVHKILDDYYTGLRRQRI